MTVLLTGYGKIGAYLYRFKILDDPTCPCNQNAQTVDYILWKCQLLKQERERHMKSVIHSGWKWPVEKKWTNGQIPKTIYVICKQSKRRQTTN